MPGPDSYTVFVPMAADRAAEIQRIAMVPVRVDHSHLAIDFDCAEASRQVVDRLRRAGIDCRPMAPLS